MPAVACRIGDGAVRPGGQTPPGLDDGASDPVVEADWIDVFLRGAPEADEVEVARLRKAIYRLTA